MSAQRLRAQTWHEYILSSNLHTFFWNQSAGNPFRLCCAAVGSEVVAESLSTPKKY